MVASVRSALAASMLVLAGASGAGAADLYRGSGVKDMPMAASPSAGWYLRGDYSHSWMHTGDLAAPSFTFSTVTVDDTWGLGGGVGRYFGRGVRGDITYEWRGTVDVEGRGNATTDFSFKTQLLMANLYYDFRPGERFTPYIGVGLGAARHSTSGGSVVTCGVPCNYDGEKDWQAAGAFMAGVSFRFDRGGHAPVSIKDEGYSAPAPGRLHLDVGYRFLYMGDVHTGMVTNAVPGPPPGPRLEDVSAHELRVGLRWDLR
jgi:opacity protein-like surface antigen